MGSSADIGQEFGEGVALVGIQVTGIESNTSGCLSVYDLEVEEDHNYFAEGVLVSNSASSSYRTIFSLSEHIYFRFGMTGTFFRSGGDDMAMHALLSETIYKISSEELRKLGHLVPANVVFLPVPGPHLTGLSSHTFQSGHGKRGIHEHEGRNQLVAWVATYLARMGRRVLVLVGTKKQGYALRGLLQAYLGQSLDPGAYQPVEFISTDMDRTRQGEVLESFEGSGTIQVLIGTTILGEGVDIPSADALV